MLVILFMLAMLPGRQPQLAARDGKVGMVYGIGEAIYYAPVQDPTVPVKVAEFPSLLLGRHRGPRLTILPGVLLITAIAKQGNLTAWRSTDTGKTWARAGTVNDVPGAAREGLHAVAAGPKDEVFAVWLDMREKGMRLYGARSGDGGATWSKNVEVYAAPGGAICECCDPAVHIDESGAVWAMWRNVSAGARDMFVARSGDGGKFGPAVKQGTGTWKINACPMDGGGFYVDKGNVTSAWRRESEIFLSEPGLAERPVGRGMDVQLVRGRRGPYVAWTRKGGGIEALLPGAAAPTLVSGEGGFVALTALADGEVLAAWEAPGGIGLKRLE